MTENSSDPHLGGLADSNVGQGDLAPGDEHAG